ncbi:MAG TPA: AAA family ATPase [Candidatus Aquilonibacter sp.]|nr:AAA family ATPase [Candidatus Aquilonibacter sp.]
MYQAFFGLREDPFRVNPDPRYLYLTPSTQEALTSLAYGIRCRYGIIVMTGEVGTGKTTLLHALLDGLRQVRAATAFVFNPRLGVEGLIASVMNDFGIPDVSPLKHEALAQLNRWLLDRFHVGQMAVLVIDEAQHLSTEALEEIRLLTNLETATEKLLQIVLSGQPELEEKLKYTQLRQLRQRITIRCHTATLTPEETQGYILKRLEIAGAEGESIFSPEALERIHAYSLGIPRVVNLLCQHSLIHAFADQRRPVSATHVAEVAREFDLDSREWPESVDAFVGSGARRNWDPNREVLCDAGITSSSYSRQSSIFKDANS